MILLYALYALVAAIALIAAVGLGKWMLKGGREWLRGHDLAPGDIEAGRYLASGHLAWNRSAATRPRPARPERGATRERFAGE